MVVVFVGGLYSLWLIAALTGLGAFAGLMINLAVSQDEFSVTVVTLPAAAGFLAGVFICASRWRKKTH